MYAYITCLTVHTCTASGKARSRRCRRCRHDSTPTNDAGAFASRSGEQRQDGRREEGAKGDRIEAEEGDHEDRRAQRIRV